MPAASAERSSRPRSRSCAPAPASTRAAAPSRSTCADRRVGSRLRGTVTVTPASAASTIRTSSPLASNSRSASPPPSTSRAWPWAVPSRTSTSLLSAIPAVRDPSARPGSSSDARSSSATAWSTALATTVGTNGPGATARPSSSTTTTSSSMPALLPPWRSSTCSPSQPRSARSDQNVGCASSGASSRARAAPRASRLRRKSEAVSARARWSPVMAMDMVGATSVGRPGPRKGSQRPPPAPWARAVQR